MRRISAVALFGTLSLIAGCRKSEPPQTPVARIDDQTLTLEAIQARLDSSLTLSAGQVQEYIQRWIDNEILYREAVRRGLDKKEGVLVRVEDARRQLAINALLEEEVYTEKSMQNTQQEVAGYYNAHRTEFALTSDVAFVSFVLFRDRDAANTFRTTVLRGTRWEEALRQVLADAQQSKFVVARVDSSYYTQSTLLPSELWRVAAAAAKGEPSFSIRTTDGFYILIVWKFIRQGQAADLAYVEKEIRSRLAIEKRRRLLEALMESLRARHAVEILIQSVSNDTAGVKPME